MTTSLYQIIFEIFKNNPSKVSFNTTVHEILIKDSYFRNLYDYREPDSEIKGYLLGAKVFIEEVHNAENGSTRIEFPN